MWRWLWCVMVLGVTACSAEEELPWWRTALFYQVYPRSFKDSDGDGVGDLKGITEKADYLKEIGVTAMWISPIFKSPMADFGYDISDYRDIDPTFGTMADFEELSKKMKELDIKLLLDLVPNHSSDEHVWFQKSVEKEDPYTNYYVWHDGLTDPETAEKKPPNNWKSVFSGSAWEWNEKRQQFYLHQFVKKQPDLNFTNEEVIKEIDEVMKFWLDKGVDGFRVDAVPFLFEDPEFRDEPALPGTSGGSFGELDHIYTQNLPRTFDLMGHWADLVYDYMKTDSKPRALFVEAYADLPTTIKYYGHESRSLMQPFNFFLLTTGNQSTRPSHLRDVINSWMTAMPQGDSANWVVGNHDNIRVADKYGPEMVDAMNLLTGVLPGVKVVYYGEEIGMRNTFIRWDQTVDPSGCLLGPDHYKEGSRDPERTPMQWDTSLSTGFSINAKTWLPVNPNYWWLTVEAQKAADTSHLKVFKAMAEARKDPIIQRGELKVQVPNDDTLVVIRTHNDMFFVLIINMGSSVAEYTTESLFTPLGLTKDMTVVVASINSGIKVGEEVKLESAKVSLRPKAAVLLKSVPPPPTPTEDPAPA